MLRMSTAPLDGLELRRKTDLLQEVVTLLTWELGAISNRKWSYLPKLRRKKAVLARRLRRCRWSPEVGSIKPLRKILGQIDQYRSRLEELKTAQVRT